MLFAIEDLLADDIEIVVVEGEEDIGKTTMLSLFAIRKADSSAVLFMRPTSRFLYDLATLRFDLCNQLNVFLAGREIPGSSKCDESFLNSLLLDLMSQTRYRKSPFYFIVDGLCDLPKEIRGSVISILPFGYKNFRFLLSGDSDQLLSLIKSVKSKPYPLAAFNYGEAERYLVDTGVDKAAIKEIWRTCRGLPGYLSGVRRLLLGGTTPEALLADMPSKLPDLFEVEWRATASSTPEVLLVLAVLAHDMRRHTIESLASVSRVSPQDIREYLSNIRFVSIDPETNNIEFISEQFRRFAATKLASLRDRVTSQVIEKLLEVPDSDESQEYLPMYFQRTGKYDDLLRFLSPEHFVRMMEKCQSLAPIQQRIELGVKAAREANRDADLIRFSMQRSVLPEACGVDIWRSEIEALLALSRTDEAIALAQTPVLREERLRLLSVVARVLSEHSRPRTALLEQIEQLYSQIDPAVLGDKSIDIASDLIHCLPKIAIEMMAKVAPTKGDTDTLNGRLAQLASAILQAKTAGEEDAVRDISTMITDPKTRFLVSIGSKVSRDSALQILDESQKLDRIEDKLLLLTQWTKVNRERADAATVVKASLDLIFRTTEYAPNARVFRGLAMPLPCMAEDDCKALVALIDGHRGSIEGRGPTEDYVRLQIALAEAQSRWDKTGVVDRLVDIWGYIENIEELETKATCLSWFWGCLVKSDTDREIEKKEGLNSVTKQSLEDTVKALLLGTADHFSVTSRTVKALAQVSPPMVLEIVSQFNTQSRRDMGFQSIIESSTLLRPSKIDLSFVNRVFDHFTDAHRRDASIAKVIEYLYDHASDLKGRERDCLPITARIETMRDGPLRCQASCYAYGFLQGSADEECLSAALGFMDDLREAWEAIDVDWLKVDAGFEVAAILAPADRRVAAEFFSLSNELGKRLSFSDWGSVLSYLLCLDLSIRAYSGLISSGIVTAQDLERVSDLVMRVPSSGERARFWSDLVLALTLFVGEAPELHGADGTLRVDVGVVVAG